LTFGTFDVFPLGQDLLTVRCLACLAVVSKDVGVSANQLHGQGVEHVLYSKGSCLSGDLAVENNLQEHISEFFTKLLLVTLIDRLEDFIGFFKQVGFQ
jgi:hypothetical protein